MNHEVQDELKVYKFGECVKLIENSQNNNNVVDNFKYKLHSIYIEEILSKQLFDKKDQSKLNSEFELKCSLLDNKIE